MSNILPSKAIITSSNSWPCLYKDDLTWPQQNTRTLHTFWLFNFNKSSNYIWLCKASDRIRRLLGSKELLRNGSFYVSVPYQARSRTWSRPLAPEFWEVENNINKKYQRYHDGDGNENIVYKANLRSFKLHRDSSNSLNPAVVGCLRSP